MLGYVIASIVSLIIARVYSQIEKTKDSFLNWRSLLLLSIPLMTSSMLYTLLRSIDLLMVKALIKDNLSVGLYSAAGNVARIGPILFLSLSSAILPSISFALKNKDLSLLQKYIKESLRYTALILFPFAAMVSATSSELSSLLYSNEFYLAGIPLKVLIIGSVFTAFFSILTTVAIATGNHKFAVYISLCLVPISVISGFLLINNFGLVGAALSTTITMFIGTMISLYYLTNKFKVKLQLLSLSKITLSSILLYFLSIHTSATGLLLIINYVVLGIIYLLLLLVLGEIQEKDVGRFKRIFSLKNRTIKTN